MASLYPEIVEHGDQPFLHPPFGIVKMVALIYLEARTNSGLAQRFFDRDGFLFDLLKDHVFALLFPIA